LQNHLFRGIGLSGQDEEARKTLAVQTARKIGDRLTDRIRKTKDLGSSLFRQGQRPRPLHDDPAAGADEGEDVRIRARIVRDAKKPADMPPVEAHIMGIEDIGMDLSAPGEERNERLRDRNRPPPTEAPMRDPGIVVRIPHRPPRDAAGRTEPFDPLHRRIHQRPGLRLETSGELDGIADQDRVSPSLAAQEEQDQPHPPLPLIDGDETHGRLEQHGRDDAFAEPFAEILVAVMPTVLEVDAEAAPGVIADVDVGEEISRRHPETEDVAGGVGLWALREIPLQPADMEVPVARLPFERPFPAGPRDGDRQEGAQPVLVRQRGRQDLIDPRRTLKLGRGFFEETLRLHELRQEIGDRFPDHRLGLRDAFARGHLSLSGDIDDPGVEPPEPDIRVDLRE
jgi:hypothetical protein